MFKLLRWNQALYLIIAIVIGQALFAATLMAKEPITSAAEIDYPPFSEVTADGQVNGFSVELLRAALNAMGRDVTFRSGTWPHVRSLLENGEIQALPLVGRTPEREPLFDFTFPYMSLHGAIVVRAETDNIHSLEDLHGRRVAVMKGDNAEEFLRREDRGLDIVTTDTFEQALQALNAGGPDAVVMQRLVALRLLQETGLDTLRVIDRPIDDFRQDFSFAVKEGDRATLALLNEGLALVIADGTYQRLHAQWFAALQLPAKQRLVVGGDSSFPPYEYLDKRGNETGFITELTRAIAYETGLDIDIRLGDWDQIVKQLATGEIDIIQGIFDSPERSKLFDFGSPHLLTHYVSAVQSEDLEAPQSYAELAGLRLVAQRGDVIVEELQARGLTTQLSLVASQEEALRQVLDGRQDCALVARSTALVLFEKNDWTGLELGHESLLERNYSFAVQKGQKALLAKLNEGLLTLQTNGEYRRIHDKWLARYQQPHSLWAALRYSAIVLIPLVLVLSAILLWSWSLRRQVAYQTRQIREDQRQLQAITETAQDAILMMNPDGVVAFTNPAIREIFGYEPEEVLGRDLHSIFRFEELLEKNRAKIVDAKQHATANGSAPIAELTTQHKDGHEINVELSLGQVLLKGGMHQVGVIRDITARKRTEQDLIAKKNAYQSILSASHDGFLAVDKQGQILDVNPAYLAFSGYDRDELLSLHISELDTNENVAEATRHIKKVMLQGSDLFESEHRRKDGSVWSAEISTTYSPLNDGRFFTFLRDITARKQAQFALEQKHQELEQFVYSVSHDLKSPLVTVKTYAGMLQQDLLDADRQQVNEDLDYINHAADKMQQLLDALLQYSRIGRINAPAQTLPASQLVDDCLSSLGGILQHHQVEVTTNELTQQLHGDTLHFGQIWQNLIENAVKYKGDQRHPKIEIGAMQQAEDVVFYVRDNGVGIAAEYSEYIFNLFSQLHSGSDGSGLGLALVKKIVSIYQGRIWVESAGEGQGSCFMFSLPGAMMPESATDEI